MVLAKKIFEEQLNLKFPVQKYIDSIRESRELSILCRNCKNRLYYYTDK